jgi:hypothetical protein
MNIKKKLLLDATPDSTLNTAASYYWGMDTSSYKGDDAMQDWFSNSPFYYTGFYLAPAPHHPDTSWMGARATLSSQGWGFLPIYVGRQENSPFLSHDKSYLNASQGTSDAQDAASLASDAGFSSNYIYLDIEQGGTLQYSIEYIKAWAQEIYTNTSYWPGIYCSHTSTNQIQSALAQSSSGSFVRYWVTNLSGNGSTAGSGTAPNPANSGTSNATAWQLVQNYTKTYGSHSIYIDINSSTMADPSQV